MQVYANIFLIGFVMFLGYFLCPNDVYMLFEKIKPIICFMCLSIKQRLKEDTYERKMWIIKKFEKMDFCARVVVWG